LGAQKRREQARSVKHFGCHDFLVSEKMKTHTETQFLTWAGDYGIGIDSSYPQLAILAFIPDPDCDRFWEFPVQPERRPYFIASMLEGMGDWKSCFVWRHVGSWPTRPEPLRLNDRIEFQILRGTGLPLGTADVIEFDRTETDALITLVFSTSIFGWSVNEDLYIVPNTGRYIVKTDHHGVIHVSFRGSDDIHAFMRFMAERGFILPNELQDVTFKRPKWMKE